MTNQLFKQIRTNVICFEKVHQPISGKIVGIILDDIKYCQGKSACKLTRKQLEYFEYLNDFEVIKPLNL